MNPITYACLLAFLSQSRSEAVDVSTDAPKFTEARTETLDIKPLFREFEGCFVAYDPGARCIYRFNTERCATRYSPCSTFKIPNSLIGIETGVVGPDTVLKWDGVRRPRESNNRDHDLQSAFRESVVWYYQELARRVGMERMRSFVDRLDYGNRDLSGGVDQFWLDGSMRISADEQVRFIDALRRGELPFSKTTLDAVREMMVASKGGEVVLRGKTGTEGREGRMVLGWYVGYVESPQRTLVFATNISAKDKAMGFAAREITVEILKSMGIEVVIEAAVRK